MKYSYSNYWRSFFLLSGQKQGNVRVAMNSGAFALLLLTKFEFVFVNFLFSVGLTTSHKTDYYKQHGDNKECLKCIFPVIFIVVPCIFNNVRFLLPTNALFIRHIKC